MVPGNKFLNNSDYKKLENNLAALNKNHTVHVEFKAVYNLGNTNSRPDGFKVEYTHWKMKLLNFESLQTLERELKNETCSRALLSLC